MIRNVRSAGGRTHGAFTWDMLAAVTGPPTSLFDERSEPDRAKSEGEPLACSLTPKIDHNEAIRHRATLDLGIARLLFVAALGQIETKRACTEDPLTAPKQPQHCVCKLFELPRGCDLRTFTFLRAGSFRADLLA
jgi:hypothetical protein